MNVIGRWLSRAAAVAGAAAAGGALAGDIFKANNTLPLNDPLSWEGGVAPGASDVAVFDERVTTNTLSFTLAADAAWAGVVFTNTVAPTNAMIGTATLATNGVDAATLTLGSNGVSLSGSGLALALSAPLALGDAQLWQLDRRNVTFNSTVSGSGDWVLNLSSQVIWNVASGYGGNLIVSNAVSVNRFNKAGRWAKSLRIVSSSGSTRWEMAFTNSAAWSTLFGDRTASVGVWNGVTAGGALQFETGDSYAFSGGRFTFDNGYGIQNGGTLSGSELQTGYADYNVRYTLAGGSLALSGGLLLGNGLTRLDREAKFRQTGGTLETPRVEVGWSNNKYTGSPTYEITGGVLRITGTTAADTGIHLGWNEYNTGGNGSESAGAFLLQGGRVESDQVALGRSTDGANYAITNAYALFKMSGGELVLGPRGFYAGRSWNNGLAGSGYAVKLQGGMLTAGDSWSSALDLFLSDRNGGTVFNTEDTNGIAKTVVLSGAVYGPGALIKRGAGVLTLAGGAAYAGKTSVEAGTLVVRALPADCYRWTADSLTDTNNAPVLVWADLNAGAAATNATVAQAPRLIRNEINGHSAVRFSSASSQYLAVAAGSSPISGATAFSIVVVFKTSSAGVGSGHWYNCTGLVDGEQGGIQNDWGLAYNSAGLIAGGAGFPAINTDTTATSGSGYSVVNGQAHVAMFTWQGTNLSLNVDGRVSVATSTSGSVSPRNTYRMLFGTMNFINYFSGDMAEIRIYRNRALSAAEQSQVGAELAATYGVPSALFSSAAVAPVAGEAASVAPVAAPDPLPYAATVWDADTLSGATGSAVTVWASTNGASAATLDAATALEGGGAIGGRTAPTLLPGSINGHHAVRFIGSSYSVLGIPAAQNPLAGVTNFSVAFVFRTEAPGRWDSNQQWWGCEGLIDAEQPGSAYDWGLSFTLDGRVAAGIGNTDATVFSKVSDLHDGAPHVAVASFSASAGWVTVMVDGLPVCRSVGAHNVARNVRRLLLGSVNGENGKFFTGDLAAFQLFPACALSESEMTSLSSALALKYGVRFAPRGNTLAPLASGLGGGDVEVAAGAALVLPAATNSPVTLASGQAIRGAGAVRGTLAVASNAVLEIGLAAVLELDGLWLRDGAVVRWTHAGGTGLTLSADTLRTAGSATLQVAGSGTLPVRVPILSYGAGEGLEATAWTVIGGKPNSRVEINGVSRTVDLVTPRGTMVCIR